VAHVLRLLVVLAPLWLGAAICRGAEQAADATCADAATTAQMQECLGERLDEADGALNRAYRDAMDTLDQARRTRLREAQRAWIAFRDASAQFEASVAEGGTLARLIYLETLVSMTRERIRSLAAIAASAN